MKRKKQKRLFRKVAVGVLAVLVCALIYAVVYSAAMRVRDPNGVPMPFGFGVSLVLSGSMEPEISTDDLVFLRKADEVRVGDVVLYDSGTGRVLHRVIRIEGDRITTQGDANNTADEPIRKSAVKGVYMGKLPGAGKFVRFVTNPPVAMLAVFALMAVAVTWMFAEEHRERKRLERLRAEVECLRTENETLRQNLK